MAFVQGLELCEHFYWEAVLPVLVREFPDLSHAAALIGPGSEVLGFDDPLSSDHDWGPRVMLFLHETDYERYADALRDTLAWSLPRMFGGYPTNFTDPDPNDGGTQILDDVPEGPVNHRVEVLTIAGFLRSYLGYEWQTPLTAADWLTFPQQKLRAITAGAVYHDAIGLGAMRAQFAAYPHDIWLYLLASCWAHIGEEEHLMGRAGLVGDEVGSALIGARLVRYVMRLCFLMERVYAPYPKWFGAAFQQLACAPQLTGDIQAALAATTWPDRERAFVQIYRHLARLHNRLKITEVMPEEPSAFFSRPIQVMAWHGFADALVGQIGDTAVKRMAARRLIGNIDIFSDSTPLREDVTRRDVIRQLFT